MRVDLETDLASDIARLRASIDHATSATEDALTAQPPAYADDEPNLPLAQHAELCRQLAALRQRASVAESANEDSRALRAELATLLFFATTLRADTEDWLANLEHEMKELERRREELERQRAAARRERERLAAEREKLVRQRDALRSRIFQTAGAMAQQNRGECRKTLPVFTLDEGLTLCSVAVSCRRRGLRFSKRWLVTLNGAHDVLVTRE
jgi:chromosome segregation ATPase